MINLCNIKKYTLDPDGSIPSKRVPRPIEDIEIIGIIKTDETIDMSNAAGCGLSGVGSITTTFDRQNRILTIQGSNKGAFTDRGPQNIRHPSGEALSGIIKSNPLRAEHGWYTIDPTYSIGYLSSNSQIKIDNIGLNNKELNAYNTKINNATYANGVLTTNNLEIINSYFYNTNITCSGIDITSDTKIDGVSANAESVKSINSSVADCDLNTAYLDFNTTSLVDSTIFCAAGVVEDCDVQSIISQQSRDGRLLSIKNSRILAKSSISTDRLDLKNNVTINGNVVSNILESVEGILVLKLGTIETNIFMGSITNSGVLSFSTISGLSKPDITNYGRLTVGTSGALQLHNMSGLCIVNNQATFVSSINEAKGIIEGSLSFENSINSGSMKGDNIKFYKQSVNYGFGNEIYFSDSNNYGIVNKGYYLCSSKNYGSGNAAEFYCDSQNMGNPGSCLFFNTSSNNNTISNAIFKDSSANKAAGTGHLFYDTSKNINAPLYEASFYNSGISSNSLLVDVNFYDTSRIDKATIPSGFVNCYGNTSGTETITINSGIVSMYDTSYAKEIAMTSYSGSLTLYNNSLIDTIRGTGHVNLYDNSTVKNLNTNGTMYDSSVCLNSQGFITLRDQSSVVSGSHSKIDAYDSAKVGGFITNMRLNDTSQFLDTNFTNGLIIGDAKLVFGVNAATALFMDGATTPSGISNITNVGFFGGSICHRNTKLHSNNVSLYDSNNEGKITANIVSYCENSNNIGTGISSLTRFGSGSINYGTISGTAYFYMGSQNLGIVNKGYYHPSISATGMSIEEGEWDASLEQLICGPPSFSFLP